MVSENAPPCAQQHDKPDREFALMMENIVDAKKSVKLLPDLDAFDLGIFNSLFDEDLEHPLASDPSSKSRLFSILSEGIISEEEAFDIGINLGEDVLIKSNHRPRSLILGYLHKCFEVDAVKVKATGANASTDCEIRVTDYMRAPILEELLSVEDCNRVNQLIDACGVSLANLHKKSAGAHPVFGWMAAKLFILKAEYRNCRSFIDVSSKYNTGEQKDQDFDVDKGILELTQEAISRRSYGIKPARIPSSIGGSWVFYDGHDFEDNLLGELRGEPFRRNYAAVAIHTSKDCDDLRLILEDTTPATETSKVRILSGGIIEAKPDMQIFIGYDGHMSCDPYGLMPIASLLKESPNTAESLQAELSANFFDLCTPILDDSMPEYRNYATLNEIDKKQFDPIIDMLVPRIKSIRRKRIEPGIEGPRRSMRIHDVVWHVRVLPSGWSASPDAIALARSVGIKLGPNETFVRAHRRGQLGQAALGHNAVQQTVSAE